MYFLSKAVDKNGYVIEFLCLNFKRWDYRAFLRESTKIGDDSLENSIIFEAYEYIGRLTKRSKLNLHFSLLYEVYLNLRLVNRQAPF